MRKALLLAALVLATAMSADARAETVTSTILPGTLYPAEAWDISPDGSIVGVFNDGILLRWTESTGLDALGEIGSEVTCFGMSDDGTRMVGAEWDSPDSNAVFNAVRWTEGVGVENVGALPDGCQVDAQISSAWDISGDGETVVGMSWTCDFSVEAFSWTEAGGFVGLGRHPGGGSRATKISGDGSTIVGWSYPPGTTRRNPVRWIDEGEGDHFLGYDVKGEAFGVSSDGSKIVGKAGLQAFYFNGTNAILFKYPSINPQDYTNALAVADDGTVVGLYGNNFYQTFAAFIWRPATGISDLKQWANDRGAAIPANLTLIAAKAISADGRTIGVQAWDNDQFAYVGVILRLEGALTDAPPAATARRATLLPARPNPFNPATTIAFDLEAASTARVSVYDIAGRLVRRLASREFGAGRHELPWNGQDDTGRTVASGTYVVRLESALGSDSQKLTLVK